jgi:uncharacterized phage-associated protein
MTALRPHLTAINEHIYPTRIALARFVHCVYAVTHNIKKSLYKKLLAARTEVSPEFIRIQVKEIAMYNAITIADEILRLAKKAGKALTPLQLMKLVYISHGWSLAVRSMDLFPDRIEAWKYGPVIPDLYQATKHFGRNPIPVSAVDDVKPNAVDAQTLAFLDDVFGKYGSLTGIQLSNLTHKSGTPWSQVYDSGVFGIEIPDEVIKNHYLSLLNERKQRPAS